MNRIYYDSEFTQLHRNSTFISIAFISESGNYFYAEFNDYDKNQINDWLQNNVINNLMHSNNSIDNFSYMMKSLACELKPGRQYNIEMVGNSIDIKNELYEWLKNECEVLDIDQIQIYTDCYAYDWMLLVDLLSQDETFIKSAQGMPKFINYIPIDLSSVLWSHDIDPDISREEFSGVTEGDGDLMNVHISTIPELSSSKHNAFFDTMVIKACFEKIDNIRGQQ